jgi:ABC-type lipoprotein export system ATPase subunit
MILANGINNVHLQTSKRTKMIESIRLSDTLPKVFEQEPPVSSEIWRHEVKLCRGGRYIIEAASGTGKSSLCAYIYGARRDYLGNIYFDDADAATFEISRWQELRRRHIAYLPQELDLFPELTALQNVELKRSLTDAVSVDTVKEWMTRLGIGDRMDYPVGKMSIGQQQRVAIVRSLCQPFDFILLDEPVSHLDAGNNQLVAEMVEEQASKQGAAIIATSVGNKLAIQNATLLKL